MNRNHGLEALTLRIAGHERTVYLRTDSSDSELVGQIFVDEAFSLARLPRREELLHWLDACRRTEMKPLVIDAGANIGLTSLVLSAQIPDALVVAIEPDPDNFALLATNTEGMPILPLPAALGGEPARAAIMDPGRGAWGIQTTTEAITDQSASVPVVTIDEITRCFAKSHCPCIVKIDIEGFESNVFSGPGEWHSTVPLVVVELHDWMLHGGRTSHPVLRRLLESDRDFVIIGENLFCMLNELDSRPNGHPEPPPDSMTRPRIG